jgi:hypothetical protein
MGPPDYDPYFIKTEYVQQFIDIAQFLIDVHHSKEGGRQ